MRGPAYPPVLAADSPSPARAHGQGQKTAAEIVKEQEELLKAKYGGLQPKKGLLAKGHNQKFFDSADWAMAKEKKGAKKTVAGTPLQPKTAGGRSGLGASGETSHLADNAG